MLKDISKRLQTFLQNVPLHQWLLPIWIIVVMAGSDEFHLPEELLRPVVVLLAFVGAVFFLLYLLLKDRQRTALLVSTSIVWLCGYSLFEAIWNTAAPAGLAIGPWIYLLFLAVPACFVLKLIRSEDLPSTTLLANTAAIFLVTTNVSFAAGREFSAWRNSEPLIAEVRAEHFDIKGGGERPDIYCLILDGMASPRILKKDYGYDNQQYLNFLKSKGFLLANAFANYPITVLSVSSSLNMDYLKFWDEQVHFFQVPIRLIQTNRLVHILRSNGYRIINVSSGFTPSEELSEADENIRCNAFTGLESALLRVSAAGCYFGKQLDDDIRANRLCPFAALEQIKKIQGPKFVLMHILLPHPPFIFAADGKPVSSGRALNQKLWPSLPYLEQAKFAEKKVEELTESLLADPSYRPMIIIHSDHGPWFDRGQSSEDILEARREIFAAFHFPGQPAEALPDPTSPVNFFRVILNRCLGTHFKILPDRHRF